MKSDVHIWIDSGFDLDLDLLVPIGATINYGVNKIPTALVALDPSSLGLLCDFDHYRRQPVTLNIETKQGCLHFPGLIDGLSFSQTPGGLTATLVLKHEFQWLTEIYPRIVGLHATTANYFRPNSTLGLNWGDLAHNQFYNQLQNYGFHFDFKLNIVDFYISLMKGAINSQGITQFHQDQGSVEEGAITVNLQQVLVDSDAEKQHLRPMILALLDKIITKATHDCKVTAGANYIANEMLNNIAMMSDDIFSNIVRIMSEIGCCIVIANSKAFIVPEASYLMVPHTTPTAPTINTSPQISSTPNIIYPSQYSQLSFNDNGYVAIKGIYVIADQGVKLADVGVSANVDMGVFIDNNINARGNIRIVQLPSLISYGLVEASVLGSAGLQAKIPEGSRFLIKQIALPDAKTSTSAAQDKIITASKARGAYMADWAEMEYCRLKYEDRTGSIMGPFNNKWAPGAVGSLYTRQPGTFLDFFVTDVVHSFSVSAPNSGSATTNILFKSGRMGAANELGLESLTLYNYGYTKAKEFTQTFVDDIG